MKGSSSLLAVCLTLALTLVTSAATPPQSKRPRTSKPAGTKTANHTKLIAAISSLEAAKTELEHSEKAFGGHKQDALDAVNNALKQLRLALQFEKY